MDQQKINIAQQLDNLKKLQEVDLIIYKLKSQKDKKPVQIDELRIKINNIKKQSEDEAAAYKDIQLKKKEKEIELETKETQVEKLNGQLFQLKTNKEYDAMQMEIKKLKADCSVLEEDILNLMDQVEKVELELKQKKAGLENQQKLLADDIKKIESEISQIESEIENNAQKRTELAGQVDAEILSKYERILEIREGMAMAPLIDGCCGGCNMQLRAQVVNEIKMKNDIIYCQMCSRILYDNDETQQN